jgi:DNA-binding PadR family transcriptional regulator
MAARTTVSYAVLGLLSLRSMNAYELVQGYGRSLGIVMSRSDAAIYAEPKRLEADGLITHTDLSRGRRVVPVYSITDAGRDELRAWLGSPPEFPQVDAEPILRVVFANLDDLDQLRANITAFRADAVARAIGFAAVGHEYQAQQGPYQHRSALVALSGRFVADLFDTYVRWCDWALDALDDWQRTDGSTEAWSAACFDDIVATLAHLAAPRLR